MIKKAQGQHILRVVNILFKTAVYSPAITGVRDFAPDLELMPFRKSQAIENDGIKSVKGSISSKKLKTLPIFPIFPPKDFRKMKAEIGAQITSDISARTGILKLA